MQNRPQLGIAGKNQAFAVTLEKRDKVGTGHAYNVAHAHTVTLLANNSFAVTRLLFEKNI